MSLWFIIKFYCMAALVYIAYSVGVDIYRIGEQCSQSGWSIEKCINVIKDYREQILAERYLKKINEIYDTQNRDLHSIGIQCFNCRINQKNKMICEESIDGLVDIENADEAFEFIPNKVSLKKNCEILSKFAS